MEGVEQWDAKCADPELLRRCKKAVQARLPEADLILYGSRARGDTYDEHSDYDLLILTDEEDERTAEKKARDALFPIEVETGAVLTIICRNRKKWDSPRFRVIPLRKNIEREGVLL